MSATTTPPMACWTVSLMVRAVGTVMVGASFPATEISTMPLVVLAPPIRVVPPSLTLMVTLSAPDVVAL